ncbi:MAG: hypothetical protein ACFFEL_07640, partial [Candidatus Thorarchaeota archaeon]
MRKSLTNTLLIGLIVLSIIPTCSASSIPSDFPNLDSILVDVVVMPNGRINVTYWMTFTAAEGGLGGFYLEGIQETTEYDRGRAYVEWGGSRYDLIVSKYTNGYALDWVPRTPVGEEVLIVFGYFSINRIVELT